MVFVIDDDPDIRIALAWLIGSIKLEVRTFSNITEFLDAWRGSDEGCLVLDVRMPGMSGMEFLEHLRTVPIDLPVIMLSGHGTISMATRALRLGAVDFLQKPLDEQLLLDRIQEAIDQNRATRVRRETLMRMASLSKREQQVADLVVRGQHNKDIARALGLSVRTVEGHRANALHKFGCTSATELAFLMQSQLKSQALRHEGATPTLPGSST